MTLLSSIALRHLLSRKRQSIVSLSGIVIGVGFFLAISSLMKGSQDDFIHRLIDNSPHITVSDEFRTNKEQAVERAFPDALIELRSIKPLNETRGIRGHHQIMDYLNAQPGLKASPSLSGQVIISFAGREENLTLSGMIPEDIIAVTQIDEYMIKGKVEDLDANSDGIIVGAALLKKLSLEADDNLSLASSTGTVRTFRIVGVFRTGSNNYDESQAYINLKPAQALFDRANRVNAIIIKMDDPYQALSFAQDLEARIGYKSLSWQEASEDILSTLVIRNIIMYSVVSAVLIVAAFGIYNIISTVVMEKHRDIAILKSMGFAARDIQKIFIIQGALLGVAGCIAGLPLGVALIYALGQVKINAMGEADPVPIPVDWSAPQFIVASAFAFFASLLAAYLPARKAAKVLPVDILRGGM